VKSRDCKSLFNRLHTTRDTIIHGCISTSTIVLQHLFTAWLEQWRRQGGAPGEGAPPQDE